ncbi:glycosyltransferase [Novosphingobium lentum]|uniref:glycosyltransferase n=1 Tax=Novosphingobium lentum TaxID=145287 RepID=UPI000830917C|nr:glycosyltransferase [Novosphingobium lentum]
MRICSVLTSLTSGGAETLVTSLSAEFTAKGHASDVVTLCDAAQLGNSADMEAHLRGQIEASGGRVISLGLGRNRNPLAGAVAMRRALRTLKPDIVHAHTARALPMLAFRAGRCPIVLTHHNSRLSFRPVLLRLFERQVRAFVAISHETRDLFERGVRTHVAYIPNAASRNFDGGVPRTRVGSPARILSVGAATAQKNYDLLIDVALAMHDLFSAEQRSVFEIAGGGPDLDRLRLRVRTLRLEDHVRFLGERSDVARLMERADIYLNTSHYEGMPISLLEAMAMGLPIVATNVPGNRELVDHGKTGVLAANGDPAGLARSIVDLAGRPDTYARLSAEALRKAGDFEIGTVAARHLQLYADYVQPSPLRDVGIAKRVSLNKYSQVSQ